MILKSPFVIVTLNMVSGLLVCLGLLGSSTGAEGKYLGPIDVVASKDGKSLYVVEADGNRIDVVDVAAEKVIQSIACPARPTGVAEGTDGSILYITCSGPKGVVCVPDPASGQVSATISVGHTACGPSLAPDGKRLYVCNRFDNDVSVIDLESKKEIQRVEALREPHASSVSPDGGLVFVSNLLPVSPANAYHVAAEITVIDTASLETSSIRLQNGSSSVRGICFSPDGKYAYVAHILSRFQIPTTQLELGWMNTNAMSLIDVASRELINTVLLDDIESGAANPWGVATTADGKQILVTHAGTHEVSVIDADALHEKLAGIPKTMAEAKSRGMDIYSATTASDVPNDLEFVARMRRRIKLRPNDDPDTASDEGLPISGPRGLAVIGSKAYVAVYFCDLLAVVDLEDKSDYPVKLMRLGSEPELTAGRRGELCFHDAHFCFQQWQSCASCHPDARMDALNWDLLNDGIGNAKNVKSMLLAHQTPPSMIGGIRENAEAAVRSGIRHIQFAVRPEGDAAAIDEYLKSLVPVPSPYLVDGELSEAAAHGKELFFSSRVGCVGCHPEPLYTDLKMHNVGSRARHDRRSDFDTPTLIEVWRTAPYIHDGSFTTIQELIGKGKHGNTSGDVESLSEQEVNDLAEFVLSL